MMQQVLVLVLATVISVFWGNEPLEALYAKARQGDAKAQQAFTRAMDSLREKAEQGDAEAQYRLGHFHYWSPRLDDSKVDFAKVTEWLEKSAKQGHSKAQFNLGLFYLGGTGVDRDVTGGIEWLTKSAEQGEEQAQYLLGILYLGDTNIAREDMTPIVGMISEAARQENEQAKFALGLLTLMGQDNIAIDGDAATALRWLKKSAEQGNAHSQSIVDLCYERKIGVEKNVK